MSTVDELTLSRLLPRIVRDGAGWSANWRSITLYSVFQPVLSITHQRIVGYEALLRATDPAGNPVRPDTLFAQAEAHANAPILDRLSRCLHVANFVEQKIDTCWLFLNALPQVFETRWPHRAFIDELSAHFGLPHERIVIELVEQPAGDEAAVARTLAATRPRDFLIAIDDFGTGFSNFDRVWRFRPDIVKLDRSLIARAGKREGDETLMTHLIAMLHQAGTLVLAEGVETDDELMILMQADVDFVQGFWFGQPQTSVQAAGAAAPRLIESMWQKYAAYDVANARYQRLGFESFAEAVRAGAMVFAATGDLAQAAEHVFRVSEARRVFVLDANGLQQRPSVASHDVVPPPARLAPLFPDTLCNWSRRAYFRHALAAPGRVAMMGPHYSLTEGEDCYTTAIAISGKDGLEVFCADFLPDRSRAGPR
ncbi:EAL domain-containing protein (putative c-di-GMP-specific phosphodiesterase class I) [Paraburkholderia sp. GAS448]|uniref:sensor domain-containing phosphodiesterase n=1 Tax=Paraburkholderia sp. GAS448 TaxID=3035136 RepID=UPI003D1E2100